MTQSIQALAYNYCKDNGIELKNGELVQAAFIGGFNERVNTEPLIVALKRLIDAEDRFYNSESVADEPTNEELMQAVAAARTALAAATPYADGKEDELTIEDYKETFEDHKRLVRELDVLLNGERNAARQASLCDIVAQVEKEGIRAKQEKGTL